MRNDGDEKTANNRNSNASIINIKNTPIKLRIDCNNNSNDNINSSAKIINITNNSGDNEVKQATEEAAAAKVTEVMNNNNMNRISTINNNSRNSMAKISRHSASVAKNDDENSLECHEDEI